MTRQELIKQISAKQSEVTIEAVQEQVNTLQQQINEIKEQQADGQ